MALPVLEGPGMAVGRVRSFVPSGEVMGRDGDGRGTDMVVCQIESTVMGR